MSDNAIAQIRAFNRFYTRQIGLLNEHVAASRFNLAEGRVLYEIAQLGHTTAGELAASLKLDPAYLSRILQKFLGLELVQLSPHPSDRRSNQIVLSKDGDRAVAELDDLNDAAIEALLAPIAPQDRDRLVAAMTTIRTIIHAPHLSSQTVIRPHRIGDLGWMIHRQAILYNQQFGWDIGFESLIAGIYNRYQEAPSSPPRDLWVAERNGAIVGSIFAMSSEGLAGSAQLRMLYVEPSARGQGVGTALVAQAVGFARGHGYDRMRLWTHTIQAAARRVYEAAGFRIVETIPEHNFGKDMTGEIWQLDF
jgi:DNA-binding MarR family transcriptional regulator/N-acetylglutamate synthase-like GNAT family acetyltransferase